MHKSVLASTLTVLIATASTASATVVGFDNFSNPGALVGSTPDVGGNWTITGTIVTNPLTVSASQNLPMTTGQDAKFTLSSSIPTSAGTSTYLGADITLSAAAAAGDYFVHWGNDDASLFWGRVFARSSGAGFQLGITGTSGGGPTYGSTVLSFGTPHQLVVAWNFVAGADNDTFDIYVNPTDPSVQANNTPYLSAGWQTATDEPAGNILSGNVRQGGATTAPTIVLDNLVYSTTFAEASEAAVVPEASSFLMAGLVLSTSGVAIALRRRRLAL